MLPEVVDNAILPVGISCENCAEHSKEAKRGRVFRVSTGLP